MLTFDDPSHTYRWNGRVVPGVTSILNPISGYDSVPLSILNRASDIGKAVHLACQMDDEGDLDEAQLDPFLAPYLDAWRQFSVDHQCVWDTIEEADYSEQFGFAGTPDRTGLVLDDESVVDIKTTAEPMPGVGPQLAAYEHLKFKTTNKRKRFAVYLKKDGTYLLKQYKDTSDFSLFASLLTLRAWCAKHDVTPSWTKS